MPEILSLSPLPATGIFSSVTARQTFVCLLRALYEAYFEFHTATPIPLLASTLGSSTKNAAEYPPQKKRHVFRPKIRSFLCPENAPRKCKWLQCVRLVINKRRPSAAVAAAPQRHPRTSPSAETPKGAPSAELQATPSRGRRPSAHTFSDKMTA